MRNNYFARSGFIFAMAFAAMTLWACGPSEADIAMAGTENRKGLANLRSKTGPAKAVEHFKKAHALHPTKFDYVNNIGVALMNQKKYDEAKPFFKQALKLDATNARAYYNLGVANQKTKDYKGAAQAYLQAARRSPSAPEIFFNLGIVYGKMGKKKVAVQSFKRFLNLAPPIMGKARLKAQRHIAAMGN